MVRIEANYAPWRNQCLLDWKRNVQFSQVVTRLNYLLLQWGNEVELGGEPRGGERERDREAERGRDRERERDRERQSERYRKGKIEIERDRDR